MNEVEKLMESLARDIAFYVKDHDLERAEKLSRILGNLLTRPDNVVQ